MPDWIEVALYMAGFTAAVIVLGRLSECAVKFWEDR